MRPANHRFNRDNNRCFNYSACQYKCNNVRSQYLFPRSRYFFRLHCRNRQLYMNSFKKHKYSPQIVNNGYTTSNSNNRESIHILNTKFNIPDFDNNNMHALIKLCDDRNENHCRNVQHTDGQYSKFCKYSNELNSTKQQRNGKTGVNINTNNINLENSNMCGIQKIDDMPLENNEEAMLHDNNKMRIKLNNNKITINLQGQQIEALIDTGATLSVISDSLLNHLKNPIRQSVGQCDIDNCTLANGTNISIKHKTVLTFYIGQLNVTTKLYILPQTHIGLIIGCDILKQLGAKIDFSRSELIITLNNVDNTIITNGRDKDYDNGYLGGIDDNKNKSIQFAPISSEIIEPKSSRRFVLKGDNTVTYDRLENMTIDIYEPVSIQFQTNKDINNAVSEFVAVIRNDNSVPCCLLADKTIMSIEHPVGHKHGCHVRKNMVDNPVKIDLSSSDLNEKQKEQIQQLIIEYQNIFAENPSDIGCTHLLTYDIRLKANTKPIRHRAYKTGWRQREIIESQVDEWLENGIIKPSMSEWAFPCLLVAKKGTDKQRLVCDFRSLNAQSEIPSYPLIDLEEFLGDLGSQNSNYFTTIDLKSAYLQVPLSERSQELCSFVCSKGQFSFLRAPFGLSALPLVFARLIDEVLRGTKHKFTQSFLDDILIYSNTFEEHMQHIKIVLDRLQQAGLTVESRKTHIAQKKIIFIGYTFSKHGIETDPANIEKVKQFPVPKTIRDIKSFLGLTGYYRRFQKDYAKIARPLNELLKKQTTFKWTSEANTAFVTLRNNLISSPILAFPDLTSEEPLKLICDASLFSSGFVLAQCQPDAIAGCLTERAIAYGSRSFTETQQRYTVTERELLAVVFAVEKMDQYLRCKKFVIITDHCSLQWLLSRKLSNINARLARWVLGLSQYNFTIVYKPGTTIQNSDCLSRLNQNNASEDISFVVEPYMNALELNKQNDNPNTQQLHSKMILPGLHKYSVENLREAQENDYWYSAMKTYVNDNKLPLSKKLSQRIIAEHQDYLVINDILYHIWNSKGKDSEPVQQICITEEFKDLIWNAMHVIANAGHLGVTKTYTKLRNRYYWPKMSSETATYVHNCEICAQANKVGHVKVPLVSLPVPTAPMQRIHIDIVAIAVRSQQAKYILVIIDAFSKYLIAKPMTRKTSFLTAKIFFQHYILIFGLPAQCYLTVTMDNGGEFVGNFNKCLQSMLGINAIFVSPYTPQANGMVERVNSTLLSILRRYAMKEANKWAQYLPYAVLAINSSHSESTGASAYELLHGTPMLDPIDLQITSPAKFTTKEHRVAHVYWKNQLMKIRSLARDKMFKAKSIQKRNYDRNAKVSNCREGDTVYLKKIVLGLTDDPKIRPMYTGPYIIKQFLSPTNVILVDAKTNHRLPRSYHINKLKRIKKSNNTNINNSISNNTKLIVPQEQKQQRDVPTETTPSELNIEELRMHEPRRNYITHQYQQQQQQPQQQQQQQQQEQQDKHKQHEQQEHHEHHEQQEEQEQQQQQQQQDTNITENNSRMHQNPQTISEEDESSAIQDQKQESIIVNCPTEDFMREVDDEEVQEGTSDKEVYYPIKKIHRKRCTSQGDREYYVSWKNRPKRDNVWIPEGDLNPALQERAKLLKIPESTQRK